MHQSDTVYNYIYSNPRMIRLLSTEPPETYSDLWDEWIARVDLLDKYLTLRFYEEHPEYEWYDIIGDPMPGIGWGAVTGMIVIATLIIGVLSCGLT